MKKIQKWKKIKIIYKIAEKMIKSWNSSMMTQCPSIQFINNEINIYYSSRDIEKISRISYITVNSEFDIIENKNEPIINITANTFDEHGMVMGRVYNNDLYYVGCGYPSKLIPWNTYIGKYDINTGKKEKINIVKCDTNIFGPCYVKHNNREYFYYASIYKNEFINDNMEYFCAIKCAIKNDENKWEEIHNFCIIPNMDDASITTPCVIVENDIFKMWYCYRKFYDYKENKNNSYKIGYAESIDGFIWNRYDENIYFTGIDIGDDIMKCYPCVFDYNGKRYMLYNGNNFSKSGILLAELEE